MLQCWELCLLVALRLDSPDRRSLLGVGAESLVIMLFICAGDGVSDAVRHHVLALLQRLSAVAPAETLFAALVELRRAEEGARLQIPQTRDL